MPVNMMDLTDDTPPDIQFLEEIVKLDDDKDDIQVIDNNYDEDSCSTEDPDQKPLDPPVPDMSGTKRVVMRRPYPPVGIWVIAPFKHEKNCGTSQQCWITGEVIKILDKKSSSPPDVIIGELKGSGESEKKEMQVSLNNVAWWKPETYALGAKGTAAAELRRIVVKVPPQNCDKCFRTTVAHYQPGIIFQSKFITNYGSTYLVYLDNGEWRYVAHKDVRLMCAGDMASFLEERRANLYPESDDFVRFSVKYLDEWNGCPWMLETKQYKRDEGIVVVAKNEKWQPARILEVDRDLVKVEPANGGHIQWIYRGSPRFKKVFDSFLVNPLQYWTWKTEPVESRLKLLDNQADVNGLASCLGFLGNIRTLSIPKLGIRKYSRDGHAGDCVENCVEKYVTKDHLNSFSPLMTPVRFGWKRIIDRSSCPPRVVYISPCGRKIDCKTLSTYLHNTKSNLHIDWFCFDVKANCLSEFIPENIRLDVKDISNGQENVKIRCVNSVDDEAQPKFHYTSKCVVGGDVQMMGEDEAREFRVCCECTDGNCASSKTCACRRLTAEGAVQAEWRVPGVPEGWSGYINRKLMKKTELEIFECNERCACQKNLCTNRVVQNGIQWPLQVFKTKLKGWGLRTAYDIPEGTFVCIYTGVLNTEEVGNKLAMKNGPEYLADLEFLPKFENSSFQHKLGYESDATEASMATEEVSVVKDKISGFELNEAFRKGLQRFTIDAKHFGNVGRLICHSCKPNMFAQRVFVDTHDLRFPQLALFTSRLVKAGSELCLDYAYEIESVPGKNIPCHCGAPDCRKRLL